MSGRVVDGIGLENQHIFLKYRGFESHLIQPKHCKYVVEKIKFLYKYFRTKI